MKFIIETTLDQMPMNYDWMQVWNIDGDADSNSNLFGILNPEGVPPGSNVDIDELKFNDIDKLISSIEGERDNQDWVCVVKMKDGRFASVRAGCDYTGWDCRSGGSSTVAKTLKELITFGLTDNERQRLIITK